MVTGTELSRRFTGDLGKEELSRVLTYTGILEPELSRRFT